LEKFIIKSLKEINQNIKIYKTDNLKSSSKYDNLILISINGYTTIDKVYELNEKIEFYSKNFLGMVMLKINKKGDRSFLKELFTKI